MKLPSYVDSSHVAVMSQAIDPNATLDSHAVFGIRMRSSPQALMEAVLWMVGLAAVGSADPTLTSAIDLCLFKAVGLPGCPGCGLGHAMGYLFRGEWLLAVQTHWFSPVVLGILITRITSLLRHAFSERSLP